MDIGMLWFMLSFIGLCFAAWFVVSFVSWGMWELDAWWRRRRSRR